MNWCTFVLSKYISGEKDNMELDIHQMSDESDYEIANYKDAIALWIYNGIEDYIDLRYDPASIRRLLNKDGKHKLLLMDNMGDSLVKQVILKVDNKAGTYYYDLRGEFRARQIFKVSHIEEDDVAYLVSEHIVNPTSDCNLIERCYKPYFEELALAKRYYNNRMKNYEISQGASSSGYRISVVSKKEMDGSKWYNTNLQAVDLIQKYDLDAEDYRYIVNIDDVITSVMADAYDDLSQDEQGRVNMSIYKAVRPFLDDDTCCQLDDDIDNVGVEELESIADIAILMAFVNAGDQETFNAIHKAMGPSHYRIGALTDEIYNEHPDEGYILLSKDGEMGWFPECYCLNEWDGAKNSPYYGKFMPNEPDTLLCLREFRPDLIVDDLPSQMEFSKYDKMYKMELAHKREAHNEMYFTVSDGHNVVVGSWYPLGLSESKCYSETVFPRNYNKYEFTIDECKDLLSGKEIVIKNYISKMGDETTIRGKLKDVSGPFDDGQRIEFSRTDIGSKKRMNINNEFGIQEPGLPSTDSGI